MSGLNVHGRDEPAKNALETILLTLRAKLLEARTGNEEDALEELRITFSLLREASYESHIDPLITVLVAMEDAARDSLIGVPSKSDIPSEDSVRLAVAPQDSL